MNALRRVSASPARRGVDPVAVVVRDFLVQALGGMDEEIAMPVHGAALDGHVGDYANPIPTTFATGPYWLSEG
jgi:hypothetical protein